jgi:hypothetical protein
MRQSRASDVVGGQASGCRAELAGDIVCDGGDLRVAVGVAEVRHRHAGAVRPAVAAEHDRLRDVGSGGVVDGARVGDAGEMRQRTPAAPTVAGCGPRDSAVSVIGSAYQLLGASPAWVSEETAAPACPDRDDAAATGGRSPTPMRLRRVAGTVVIGHAFSYLLIIRGMTPSATASRMNRVRKSVMHLLSREFDHQSQPWRSFRPQERPRAAPHRYGRGPESAGPSAPR